jgi:hypothetical protein
MGEGRYRSTILDFGTRWRWVASFTPRLHYPWGNHPQWRLGRPQSRPGQCGATGHSLIKVKISQRWWTLHMKTRTSFYVHLKHKLICVYLSEKLKMSSTLKMQIHQNRLRMKCWTFLFPRPAVTLVKSWSMYGVEFHTGMQLLHPPFLTETVNVKHYQQLVTQFLSPCKLRNETAGFGRIEQHIISQTKKWKCRNSLVMALFKKCLSPRPAYLSSPDFEIFYTELYKNNPLT